MNLDDLPAFTAFDSQHVLQRLDALPAQLLAGWEQGQRQPMPGWPGIDRVLIVGMGSAISGADLLAAHLAPTCPVPLVIHQDYELPAWANGPHTLVLAVSQNGESEETLHAYRQAGQRGCARLALTGGGTLWAEADTAARWRLSEASTLPASAAETFGLLLAALARCGLAPANSEAELSGAHAALLRQQQHLLASVPAANNPAKRMAGQMVGRWVTVFASGHLAPVARHWKRQLNVMAKAWAETEIIPEADHNTLGATMQPAAYLPNTLTFFLRAASEQPRNNQRTEFTRKMFMLEGICTDFYTARGESALAQQWTLMHMGDYIAYYLAMAYGIDPAPAEVLGQMKAAMAAQPE